MKMTIRHLLLVIALIPLSSCGGVSSRTNPGWTWMGGSYLTGAAGVYGTKGTASAANVPGSRYIAVSWTDSNGNLWMLADGMEPPLS